MQNSFGAGWVATVDSALELMVQKGFLLPWESLPAVQNIVYLVIAQCSSCRHSLAASPPTWAGWGTPSSFFSLGDLSCAFITQETRSLELWSSHFCCTLVPGARGFILLTHLPSVSPLLIGLSCLGTVGFICCCLGNQGLSRGNSGFILHLVRFLVGCHDKCELKLCQKSTWRVNVCKMDKYVICERVCCALGVCTNALLLHRDCGGFP